MSKWDKTDKQQKWQWNNVDESLHAWIDTAAYEPQLKFGNSYCSNQADIPAAVRADNLTKDGPNGGELQWLNLDQCNSKCHSKTWCKEFTWWKKDSQGLCRLYGEECKKSANDNKWDHYTRSMVRAPIKQ